MNDLRREFKADKNNTILRLENITKIYPGTVALHRVNLVHTLDSHLISLQITDSFCQIN